MKNLPQLLVQLNDVAVLDLKTVLSSPPESPITSPIGDSTSSTTIVLAENVHWHSALIDSFRPIDALRTYQGSLCFVYGDDDIAIPRDLSIALIRNTKLSGHTIKIIRLKNADHGLRFKDKSLNEEAEERLVFEIIRLEKSIHTHRHG